MTNKHGLATAVFCVCVYACGDHHDDANPVDASPSDATVADATPPLPFGQLDLIIGQNGTQAVNAPADWTAAAGAWNGKFAKFNAAKQLIAFQTQRLDITGGQIDASSTDPVGGSYFVSGSAGGTLSPSATTVIYVANPDGTSPRCIGCADVVDSTDGVEIYKVALSTGAAATPQRQPSGTKIDANRHKDLPYWYPTGDWIIAGVEMPKHGLAHSLGNSDVGGWVDVWAISTDGKIWVQLTDFASTWTTVNATSGRPLQCAESPCATACQGVVATNSFPFQDYACSPAGVAPPVVGIMRPVVTNAVDSSGVAKIAWSERVGWVASGYPWGGPLNVAIGDLVLVAADNQMLPAIGSYERSLTPTPGLPSGRGVWKAADANVIGKGYETWGFTPDDQRLVIASDSFIFSDKLSSSKTAWQLYGASTQGFSDDTSWDWHADSPAYDDLTKHDAVAYPYMPNGSANATTQMIGHWEEPVTFSSTPATPFIAFGSSANLTPAWDPDNATISGMTFALEVWIMRTDHSAAATRITSFSSASSRFLTYPTAVDDDIIYIASVPQLGLAGTNQPGNTYRYRVAPL